MNMINHLCYNCKQPLLMSDKRRKNGSYVGSCKPCKLMHSIYNGVTLWSISRRFKCGKHVWHMTYRLDSNETNFVIVRKMVKRAEKIKHAEVIHELIKTRVISTTQGLNLLMNKTPRIEHFLPGFVMPERFINLIPFL